MHDVHTLTHVDRSTEVLDWLAKAMKRAREDAGIPQALVAAHAGVREFTVGRWEESEHWPRDLDRALAAYVKATDLGSTRALWELALHLWAEHDENISGLDPGERLESLLGEEDPPSEDTGDDSATAGPDPTGPNQ